MYYYKCSDLSLSIFCSTCGSLGRWECEQNACLIEADMIHAVNRGNYGYKTHNQVHLSWCEIASIALIVPDFTVVFFQVEGC